MVMISSTISTRGARRDREPATEPEDAAFALDQDCLGAQPARSRSPGTMPRAPVRPQRRSVRTILRAFMASARQSRSVLTGSWNTNICRRPAECSPDDRMKWPVSKAAPIFSSPASTDAGNPSHTLRNDILGALPDATAPGTGARCACVSFGGGSTAIRIAGRARLRTPSPIEPSREIGHPQRARQHLASAGRPRADRAAEPGPLAHHPARMRFNFAPGPTRAAYASWRHRAPCPPGPALAKPRPPSGPRASWLRPTSPEGALAPMQPRC